MWGGNVDFTLVRRITVFFMVLLSSCLNAQDQSCTMSSRAARLVKILDEPSAC